MHTLCWRQLKHLQISRVGKHWICCADTVTPQMPATGSSKSPTFVGRIIYGFEPSPRKNYYVNNPTTTCYTILPPFSVCKEASTCRIEFSLSFDPSKSPYYKVVCVVISNSMDQVEIYSFETGSWWLCTGFFLSDLLPYNVVFDGGVYWNGFVHWINSWDSAVALYFNVDKERMSKMPLPYIPEEWEHWDESNFEYFGESGDHSHLIDDSHIFVATGLGQLRLQCNLCDSV